MPWRLGELDPRFGLDAGRAEEAIRTAAALWSDAAGRPLFRHEPDGIPVHFTWDDRQARVVDRAERMGRLDPRMQELAARQAELDARGDRIAEEGLALEADARAWSERRARHNDEVRRWNSRGGAPTEVAETLNRAQDELEAVRRDLERRRDRFDASQAEFRREVERLRQDIDAHNRDVDAFDREYGSGGMVESGRYTARTRGGRVVGGEIQVYRFDGPDDLVLVLAHELGHALGLGHTPGAGGVMSEVSHRSGPPRVAPVLQAGERELLAGLCGEGVEAAGR